MRKDMGREEFADCLAQFASVVEYGTRADCFCLYRVPSSAPTGEFLVYDEYIRSLLSRAAPAMAGRSLTGPEYQACPLHASSTGLSEMADWCSREMWSTAPEDSPWLEAALDLVFYRFRPERDRMRDPFEYRQRPFDRSLFGELHACGALRIRWFGIDRLSCRAADAVLGVEASGSRVDRDLLSDPVRDWLFGTARSSCKAERHPFEPNRAEGQILLATRGIFS